MIRPTSDMHWLKCEPASINEQALYLVKINAWQTQQQYQIMSGKTIAVCLRGKSNAYRPLWMARIVDPVTDGC